MGGMGGMGMVVENGVLGEGTVVGEDGGDRRAAGRVAGDRGWGHRLQLREARVVALRLGVAEVLLAGEGHLVEPAGVGRLDARRDGDL